ncbi:MAG: RsmB/NOP family class I SAM-dependent RNA methyltransferase [Bdellovibrionales bacterium]|nr:RsmB/NOP family class I SAM-dependent RNA methyltransferase [Bdellovibrionales bacterium]
MPSRSSQNIKGAERVARQLFDSVERQEAFLEALERGARDSLTAVIWSNGASQALDELSPSQAAPFGLPSVGLYQERDTIIRSEAHLKGDIYLVDPASVFMASVVGLERFREARLIVDVCAAPGGKSLLAAAHRNSLCPIVSNEKSHGRASRLIANLERCQIPRAAVSRVDPKTLGTYLTQYADVVLVDAPCSGQSLICKGENVPGAFHPINVKKNVGRQRRILAEASKIVRPGGVLAYMTCTFSREENEGNVEWFLEHFPEFKPIEANQLGKFRSSLSDLPCYRLFPNDEFGAGGFTALCYHTGQGSSVESRGEPLRFIWKTGDFSLSDIEEL